MARVFSWLKKETLELLPAFVFFLVAFSIIVLTDELTTAQYGIRPFKFAAAFVLALVVAKVMLLTDFLPFIDTFRTRPLIYNTLWKAAIYNLVALIVRYVERLAEYTFNYGSLASANRHLFSDIVWSRFWAVQIWLIVTFIVFVAVQELSRRLGPRRLRQMFVGR